MGFGGATSAMIASLKHNKRTRKTSFEKLEKYQKEDKCILHFEKKASKKLLKEIRNNIKTEKRVAFIKNIIFLFVVAIALYYLIGFAIF